MSEVFLNAAGSFLPGNPVGSKEMEAYIGEIDEQASRMGRKVLAQNRIRQRYYAINPDGSVNYTNAGMAALAGKNALKKSEVLKGDVDFLATSTTQGDLLVPGHASAVHAELGLGKIEIASFRSVCASSMMAARMAYLNIKADEKKAALVTGSEFSSRWFRPGMYKPAEGFLEDNPDRMSAEFLRWTLSDGAGAILFEPKPNERGPSFKVEWIDLVSFAPQFDPCMFAGSRYDNRAKPEKVWSHYGDPTEAAADGAIILLQDFKTLKRIIRTWVGHYLKLVEAGKIIPEKLNRLLCHYSAHSLKEEIIGILETTGGMIPREKWFTNLYSKGNTGAASLFVMLDEFMATETLESGEQILCIVPESGRGIVSFMMLSAV